MKLTGCFAMMTSHLHCSHFTAYDLRNRESLSTSLRLVARDVSSAGSTGRDSEKVGNYPKSVKKWNLCIFERHNEYKRSFEQGNNKPASQPVSKRDGHNTHLIALRCSSMFFLAQLCDFNLVNSSPLIGLVCFCLLS